MDDMFVDCPACVGSVGGQCFLCGGTRRIKRWKERMHGEAASLGLITNLFVVKEARASVALDGETISACETCGHPTNGRNHVCTEVSS